jgi:hypothetical protein
MCSCHPDGQQDSPPGTIRRDAIRSDWPLWPGRIDPLVGGRDECGLQAYDRSPLMQGRGSLRPSSKPILTRACRRSRCVGRIPTRIAFAQSAWKTGPERPQRGNDLLLE